MQCYQREKGHVTFHLGKPGDNRCSSACFIYYSFCQQLYFTSPHPHQYSQWERNLNSHIKWGRGVRRRAFWNGDLLKPDSSDWLSHLDDPGWLLTDAFHQDTRVISWTAQNGQNQIMLAQADNKKKPWERFLCKQVTVEVGYDSQQSWEI